MNITYRIPHPTVQYAYVELTGEIGKTTDPDEIRQVFDLYNGAFQDGAGIPDKDFNRALDEFLTTGTLRDGADIYASMKPSQQNVFQQIKKSLKRTKNYEPEVDYQEHDNQYTN